MKESEFKIGDIVKCIYDYSIAYSRRTEFTPEINKKYRVTGIDFDMGCHWYGLNYEAVGWDESSFEKCLKKRKLHNHEKNNV